MVSLVTTGNVSAQKFGEAYGSSPWLGDLAELIVYDRALTPVERKEVEDYLAQKYAAYVVTAGAPEFTPNGATFEGSVEVSLHSPTPGVEIRYTTNGSEPTNASELYAGPFVLTTPTMVQARAFRAGMNPSPVSFAHFTPAGDLSPPGVPGLVLWARADVGATTDAEGRVSSWRDVSGRGTDLVQASAIARPSLVPNVQAGLPALRFDGADDALLFKDGLTNIRTVFWVVREEASAPGGYRFLLGDATNYHFCSGDSRQIWSGYSSAAAVLWARRGSTASRSTAKSPTARPASP